MPTDERDLTAKLSWANPLYYGIYLNGKLWRVCHKDMLEKTYPGIKIIKEEEK